MSEQERYKMLYIERSCWIRQSRLLKYDRMRWREYVSLNAKIKERTEVLKQLSKVKPEGR